MKMRCKNCSHYLFRGEDRSNLIGGPWYRDDVGVNHLVAMCRKCFTTHDLVATLNPFSLLSGSPMKCVGVINLADIEKAILLNEFDKFKFPKPVREYLVEKKIYFNDNKQKNLIQLNNEDEIRSIVHTAGCHTRHINEKLKFDFSESDVNSIHFSWTLCAASLKVAFDGISIEPIVLDVIKSEFEKIFRYNVDRDLSLSNKKIAEDFINIYTHESMLQFLIDDFLWMRNLLNHAEIENIKREIGKEFNMILLLNVNILNKNKIKEFFNRVKKY